MKLELISRDESIFVESKAWPNMVLIVRQDGKVYLSDKASLVVLEDWDIKTHMAAPEGA